MSACGTRAWDVPDWNMEPPEEHPSMQWCDRCFNWRHEHCEEGWGWCTVEREFLEPDKRNECPDFDGEPPTEEELYGEDPRVDMMREEGW